MLKVETVRDGDCKIESLFKMTYFVFLFSTHVVNVFN